MKTGMFRIFNVEMELDEVLKDESSGLRRSLARVSEAVKAWEESLGTTVPQVAAQEITNTKVLMYIVLRRRKR